jgi:hypothetical protein
MGAVQLKNASKVNLASQRPAGSNHWFTRNSLRRAFRKGTCPICAETIHEERRAIHSFLHEGMMSGQARKEFLDAGGFCSRHFWIAKEIEQECWPAGGIGVAILCENLLGRVLEGFPSSGLGEQRNPFGNLLWWRRAVNRRHLQGCTFCQSNENREKDVIVVLESLCDDKEFKQMLREGPLCVRHATDALRSWRDAQKRGWLVQLVCEQMESLIDDLREFIRKHDWQYRNEVMGREADAVVRSISVIAAPRDPRAGMELNEDMELDSRSQEAWERRKRKERIP